MAICIVALILVQDPKGGAMGVFGGGGGSQTVFGSSGGGDFLTKATRMLAIIFAATSISLAYMTSSKSKSVLDNVSARTATLPTTAATANKAAEGAIAIKDKAMDAAKDAAGAATDKAAGALTGAAEKASETIEKATGDR